MHKKVVVYPIFTSVFIFCIPSGECENLLASRTIGRLSITMSAKLKKQIKAYLVEAPMSLGEIAEKMELEEKKTFKLLRSLFQKDEIKMTRREDGVRCYTSKV